MLEEAGWKVNIESDITYVGFLKSVNGILMNCRGQEQNGQHQARVQNYKKWSFTHNLLKKKRDSSKSIDLKSREWEIHIF